MTANLKVQAFKKGLIMETAQRLFCEKPYESVTVEEIAKAAGFGKSTLYSFFESKEEILDSIIKAGLEHLSEEFEKIAAQEPDAPSALNMFIPLQYRFFLEFNSHLFTYIQKSRSNAIKKELRDELKQLVKQKTAHLSHLIYRGIQAGIFIEADPDYLAWLVNSMIKGICMPSLLQKAELRDQAQDIDMLRRVILKGILAESK